MMPIVRNFPDRTGMVKQKAVADEYFTTVVVASQVHFRKFTSIQKMPAVRGTQTERFYAQKEYAFMRWLFVVYRSWVMRLR